MGTRGVPNSEDGRNSITGRSHSGQEKREGLVMAKGIYERKGQGGDVTYYIRYQYQGIDRKEHVGRKSRGFTREMAREALKSRLGDIAKGYYSLEKTRKAVPFSLLFQRFDEYARTNWRSYGEGKYLLRPLAQYFGDTPLSQITAWQIEKWKSELRKTLKPNSVNRHLTVLRHMFKKAIEWGFTRVNPTGGVRRFPSDDQRNRYLTEDEIPRVLAACKDLEEGRPWLWPAITVAIHSGMRRGELADLRWNNLDFDHGLISLQQGKTLKIKTIPMNETVREVLDWVYNNRRYGEYVFMHPWGKPIHRNSIWEGFKEACKQAGIRDCHLHDTRHTFASHLVMADVDLTTVSKLMGHSKINMTMRYAHLAPKHEAEAVAKLNTRLAQNRNISETQKQKVVGIANKSAKGRLPSTRSKPFLGSAHGPVHPLKV